MGPLLSKSWRERGKTFPGLGTSNNAQDLIRARDAKKSGILSMGEPEPMFPGIQPCDLLVTRERTITGELVRALTERPENRHPWQREVTLYPGETEI